MNVSLEKKDELNALISIHIEKSDYEQQLEQQLKEYRKKAKLPGFRPGQAPLGMIRKMVGKSMLYEEVNKLTSNKLYDYLHENNIDILGQPMTSLDKESKIDFEEYGDFTFHFDLGLAPLFELKISPKDKLIRYEIEVDNKELETEIKNLRRQQGAMEEVQSSADENDSRVLILTETDKSGVYVSGGVFEQEATVLPEIITDKKTKKQLIDLKVGENAVFNVFKLFNENEMVISHSLGIEKEAVKLLNKNFKAEVKQINHVTAAEMNQEFFDQVLGPAVVDNEADFRLKIRENLELYYKSEAEKQLESEINTLLRDKHKLKLPDEFLKRWLKESKPEDYTDENIDERYAEESEVLRKQLIREKIAAEENIEVSAEDLDQTSYAYTAQILRQYGIANPDPQLVQSFENKNREDKSYMLRIRDVVVDKKVLDALKKRISIHSKKISVEKFYAELKRNSDKLNK